jgi:hypothetical protein
VIWDITSNFVVNLKDRISEHWGLVGSDAVSLGEHFFLDCWSLTWRHNVLSKCRKLLVKWRSVTSHKTAVLSSTAVRNSNLASLHKKGSDLIVLFPYYISTWYHQMSGIYHIVRRTFLFTVDKNKCPALWAIVSQVFFFSRLSLKLWSPRFCFKVQNNNWTATEVFYKIKIGVASLISKLIQHVNLLSEKSLYIFLFS